MKHLKKHGGKLFSILVILAILGYLHFTGEPIDIKRKEKVIVSKSEKVMPDEKPMEGDFEFSSSPKNKNDTPKKTEEKITIADTKQNNKLNADKINDEKSVCTLTIRCDTIRDKQSDNSAVPASGIILDSQVIEIKDGESVFDVLLRETKAKGIHLEFSKTPLYDGAYIEGINNIYEFDFGELSGWMYSVNGVFPNYGCSSYKVKNNDKIVWEYTLDLGKDIGAEHSTKE